MTYGTTGIIRMIYVAKDGSNEIVLTSSNDGISWDAPLRLSGQSTKAAPSLDEKIICYVANNETNNLLTTIIDSSESWQILDQSSDRSPDIKRFGSQYLVAYVSNNGRHDLLTASLPITFDPSFPNNTHTWSESRLVGNQSSKAGPALAVFNNQLVMSYIANDDSNRLLITVSTDGENWSDSSLVGEQSSKFSPALATFNDQLVIAYVANNDTNALLTAVSSDGINWSNSRRAGTGHPSASSPSLTAVSSNGTEVSNGLMLAYIDNTDALTTTFFDGILWSADVPTGQYSQTSPSIEFSFHPLIK